MKRALATLAVSMTPLLAVAQSPEDLIAGLKSSIEADRVNALIAIGKLPTPGIEMLEPVAESLLDEAESVRVAAAYSLAGVAGKVGCKLDELAECRELKAVLDGTPKAIKKVPPIYPDEAKRTGIQGSIRMEILVTAEGRVQRIRVVSGTPLIDRAAVDALKQWTFEPAKRKGKAVPFAMVQTLRFRVN